MFSTLPIILISVLSLSGEDTVKKKPQSPAKSVKTAPRTASGVIARVASETMQRFAGPTVGKALSGAAKAATPRAPYLSHAIASRLSRAGGPPLPARFRGTDASTVTADSIVVEKSRRTLTLYRQGEP